MRSNFEPLGKYIRKVNDRNDNSEIETLKGINIDKEFMPSVANTIGSNMARYRVVSQWQFAYNPMHVGRDEVLPISMLKNYRKVIVSPAYIVFEIKDHNQLNPEYLMMWCRRSEFDRNAWFTTDNSVRGGFSWESLCEMELPIPSIEKQREIVAEYNVVVDRIELNETINQKLEETAKLIYRQWFEEFEFPISKEYAESISMPELEGKQYKSSGGEMVYNEELDKEIPVIWQDGKLSNLFELKRGFDLPTRIRVNGEVPIYAASGITGYHNTFKVKSPGVVTGRSGSLGIVELVLEDFWPLNTTLWVEKFYKSGPLHAYFTLSSLNIEAYKGGSAVPTLNRNFVHEDRLVIPSVMTIKKFELITLKLFQIIKSKKCMTNRLEDFQNILLAKMT